MSDRLLAGVLGPYVEWVPGRTAGEIGVDGRVAGGAVGGGEALPLLVAGDDARALARFAERIFAHARLRTLLAGDWGPRDLIEFHTRHKMQVLAHDPARYREAGRVVAGAGIRPPGAVAGEYAEVFRRALATPATVGKNVNVLQHCLGMLGLDPARRDEALAAIDAYRAGRAPLSRPATLLHRQATGYVRDQTYFAPYPDGLRDALGSLFPDEHPTGERQ
ncbi:YbgA family protein [Nonomuraea deserti]|uniref:YbgA family protein n=1 Tax=Nonomuraea deserti TaxID=1848322 RepID=UPI001FEA9EBC|nr:YbgA family protein [Nonomuraea deserti]